MFTLIFDQQWPRQPAACRPFVRKLTLDFAYHFTQQSLLIKLGARLFALKGVSRYRRLFAITTAAAVQ